MKDWFKARNIWGAAILALSDAEAGRLAKALWTYTMTGEQQNLSGAEKGTFAMILMTLGGDERADADISQKRARAGSMGGKQKQANASKSKQNVANGSKPYEKESTPRPPSSPSSPPAPSPKPLSLTSPLPPIVPLSPKEKGAQARFTPPTVEEVSAYCRERGNMVDAQQFVDFYASKGWRVGNQPMKDWKAAVRTWERRESSETKKPAKVVSAQQYHQRQYTEEELGEDTYLEMLEECRKMREPE